MPPWAALMAIAVVIGNNAADRAGSASDAGVDLGAAIDRCIARLPSVGGECDMRELPGHSMIRTPLLIRRDNVRIRLPNGAIDLSPGAFVGILASNVDIRGASKGGTTLYAAGTRAIAMGTQKDIVRRWRLANFTVVSRSNSGAGITFENAREGRVEDVAITGFNKGDGAALLVGDNSWSVIIDDSILVGNATGIAFRGGNANAWVVRSCNVSNNDTGVLISIGAFSAHGIAFVAGTHFEENKSAAINVSGGSVYGLTVSDAYVELREGQRLLQVRGSGRTPCRLLSFSYTGGYITAGSTPVIDLDTGARPGDVARVDLQNFFVARADDAIKPVLSLAGTGCRVSVAGGGVSMKSGAGMDIAKGALIRDGATLDVAR